jgi:hypothetical protein
MRKVKTVWSKILCCFGAVLFFPATAWCGRTVVSLVAATAALASWAAPVPLQSNVTWYWLKPNTGTNLSNLLSTDAYVEYGGQRLDSFLFFGASGTGTPVPVDLWLVFSEFSGFWKPKIVFYDPLDESRRLEASGQMQFGVSWRVSNLDSTALTSAHVGATEVSAGLFGNAGSASIQQTVFGDGDQILGQQTAALVWPAFGPSTQSALQFEPQQVVRMSSLVTLDNGGFFTFGAVARHGTMTVPEPSTFALLCGVAIGLWRTARRRSLVFEQCVLSSRKVS